VADNWQQTRLDHRARQSEAIATAALSLILEHGASALTMAAIATAADISRQTLYRYYPDIDAVLVGIAELIGSHDGHLEADVLQQANPQAQLDFIVRTVIQAGEHDPRQVAAVRGTLPPQAREVLAQHEDRVVQLLANVLKAGTDDGVFRGDIDPLADAPLILGLASAANPSAPERAIDLVHRMVAPNTQESPT
jgi:AcrR family transcriptional regulator